MYWLSSLIFLQISRFWTMSWSFYVGCKAFVAFSVLFHLVNLCICSNLGLSQVAPDVKEVLDTFRVAAELGSDSLGAYVISMASNV